MRAPVPTWGPRWLGPLVVGLVALVSRLAIRPWFWGWEEEDFTNINLSLDIAQLGLGDMPDEYPPAYYVLAGLLGRITGSVETSTLALTMGGGVALVVIVFLLGRRLFCERVAWGAGLLACLQPQLLLYSSTPLREPFYAAVALASVWLVMEARHVGASTGFAVTALTRYEAWFSSVPFHLAAIWRTQGWRALWRPVAVYAAAAGSWVVYVGVSTGRWNPMASTLSNNAVEGPAGSRQSAIEWVIGGASTAGAFFGWALPQMVGPVLLLAAVALLLHTLLRDRSRDRQILAWFCAVQLALLAAIVWVGQFDPPDHPLYKKWSVLACAALTLWGVAGVDRFVRALARRGTPARARGLLVALVVAATLVPFGFEVRDEIRRSDATVRPQVEIARWIEATYPQGASLLLDQIALFALNWRPHDYRLLQWQFLPEWGDDGRGWAAGEEQLGRFLQEREVQLVLWCREEWTKGPEIAPYLEEARDHTLGPVQLKLVHADEAYGFRLYQVFPSP